MPACLPAGLSWPAAATIHPGPFSSFLLFLFFRRLIAHQASPSASPPPTPSTRRSDLHSRASSCCFRCSSVISSSFFCFFFFFFFSTPVACGVEHRRAAPAASWLGSAVYICCRGRGSSCKWTAHPAAGWASETEQHGRRQHGSAAGHHRAKPPLPTFTCRPPFNTSLPPTGMTEASCGGAVQLSETCNSKGTGCRIASSGGGGERAVVAGRPTEAGAYCSTLRTPALTLVTARWAQAASAAWERLERRAS